MTIPSPSSLHFRYGRDAVPETIYPTMDDFYCDLGQTYRKAVRAFADAGCRYLQLDEVNFTYLCDPKLRAAGHRARRRSGAAADIYAGMINAAISDIPADMTITMHLCRGNFQSTFVAVRRLRAGGGNAVQHHQRARLFHGIRQRPRRRLRAAALGAERQDRGARPGHLENRARSKPRTSSSAASIRRRNSSPLDQLCLSPQCGFASTEEGNILAEDEQWAKLR